MTKGIAIYSQHHWHSGKTFRSPSKGSNVLVQPPLLALGERKLQKRIFIHSYYHQHSGSKLS